MEYMVKEDDIRSVLGHDTPVITYAELKKYSNIIDLLPSDRSCAAILTTFDKPNCGHWCLLSRYGTTIEWFDSYGGAPDSELKYADPDKLEALGESEHDLKRLLDTSPNNFHVIYNHKHLQSQKDGVNTCGRWTCLRGTTMKRGQSLNDFIGYVKKNSAGRSPDEAVVRLMPF